MQMGRSFLLSTLIIAGATLWPVVVGLTTTNVVTRLGGGGLSSSRTVGWNHRVPVPSTSSSSSWPSWRLTSTRLAALPEDVAMSSMTPNLEVIGLVAGQENFGLAVVVVAEALYSFSQAPSLANIKILVPAALAGVLLVLVSGPMITSGSVDSVGSGLWISLGVSFGLVISYILRLLENTDTPTASSSSSPPKEYAALGLLLAVAGLFSFGQNLVVDGFVSLPVVTLPSLPSL